MDGQGEGKGGAVGILTPPVQRLGQQDAQSSRLDRTRKELREGTSVSPSMAVGGTGGRGRLLETASLISASAGWGWRTPRSERREVCEASASYRGLGVLTPLIESPVSILQD